MIEECFWTCFFYCIFMHVTQKNLLQFPFFFLLPLFLFLASVLGWTGNSLSHIFCGSLPKTFVINTRQISLHTMDKWLHKKMFNYFWNVVWKAWDVISFRENSIGESKQYKILVMWSQLSNLYYHNTYCHQNCQIGGTPLGAPSHKVIWSFNCVVLWGHMRS